MASVRALVSLRPSRAAGELRIDRANSSADETHLHMYAHAEPATEHCKYNTHRQSDATPRQHTHMWAHTCMRKPCARVLLQIV